MTLLKNLITITTGVIIVSGISACVGGNNNSTNNSTSTQKSITTKADLKVIFYDMNNSNGYSGNLGGVSGADKLCQDAAQNKEWHPNLPQEAKWKALIAVKGIREPGAIDNKPLDWALQPGVTYMNESLEIFGQATEYGTLKYPSTISLYKGPSLDFIKNNSKAGHLFINAWTGIHISSNDEKKGHWYASPWNCESWSSNIEYQTTGELEPVKAFGGTGKLNGGITDNFEIKFNNTEIDNFPSRCHNTSGLICVQQ